jgi:3-carboxy-cis,cis-muconate cycloisomerase
VNGRASGAGLLTRVSLGHDPTRRCFEDRALIVAMVRFESALAKAQAEFGVIPEGAAMSIAGFNTATIDPDALALGMRGSGVPVPALLEQMRAGLDRDAAGWLHHGATSQDVVDTALCLCFRAALDGFEPMLAGLLDALGEKSEAFGDTPMLARTRGQLATPITAGLRLAEWAQPLIALEAELPSVRAAALRVQFGGASGSRSVVAPHGASISRGLAEALGLRDGPPWHTDRSGFLRLASWLSRLVTALGKIGRDLELSSRGEIAEMRAGVGGGSSTMPHKSNPVTAEILQTLAVLAQSHEAGLVRASVHGEERDGAMWAVEWALFPQLFEVAGAALDHAAVLVGSLSVDPQAMRARIDATPAVLAEAAVFALAPSLGRIEAKRVVSEALSAPEGFIEALAARTAFDWSGWDPSDQFTESARAVAQQIFAARDVRRRSTDRDT